MMVVPYSLAGAVLVSIVAMLVMSSSSPAAVLAADDDGTTHLHLFMHDIVTGSNPTAVQVIKGPASGGASAVPGPGLAFGDTFVIDDALTETSSPTSAELGRMQGLYMVSSQSGAVLTVCANLLLTAGEHNGSTVAVMGRDDIAADVRELSVVGGTGSFRMATGYVLWRSSSVNGPDATIELDVYVTTTGGGGGGGGGSASSGAAAVRVQGRRWVNACLLVALVVLVW